MKYNWLDKYIKYVLTILLGIIMVILLLMGDTKYVCKTVFLRTNINIFILNTMLSVVALGFMYILKRKIKMSNSRKIIINCDKTVKVIMLVLFFAELYISYNIHFRTGWDLNPIWDNANEIAFGTGEYLNNEYYSQNPNNLFITIFSALILKLNSQYGIFHDEHENMSLIFINCICISLACYLVYKELKFFVKEQLAFIGYVIAVLLLGLSPWMTICYSDTLGILFPILIVYLYTFPVNSKMKKVLKYTSIIIVSSIGYYIKPQILIVFIAIFIVEFGHSLRKNNRRQLFLICIFVSVWMISVLGTGRCFDKIYKTVGFEINKDAAFGPTHYFMMGLNEERNGVWAQEDVDISSSCKTLEERRSVNIQVSIQRLKEYGIIGYARHLSKKMLCTFNDGTFAWMREGAFFFKIYDEPNTRAASFLRSFFYKDGKYLDVFRTFEQTIWMFVLTMCSCAALLYKNNVQYKKLSVVMLSLIGITLFEALFEVRARYLFIYVPFFCMLSVMGINVVWEKFSLKMDKILDKNL